MFELSELLRQLTMLQQNFHGNYFWLIYGNPSEEEKKNLPLEDLEISSKIIHTQKRIVSLFKELSNEGN